MAKRREEYPAKIVGQNKAKLRRNNDCTKAKRSRRQRRKKTALPHSKKQQESDAKRMIQRPNEESGCQENALLSTLK